MQVQREAQKSGHSKQAPQKVTLVYKRQGVSQAAIPQDRPPDEDQSQNALVNEAGTSSLLGDQSLVEDTPLDAMSPSVAEATDIPPPSPPPSLPATWVPVRFLQDGPWRMPDERLQPGPLVVDLIFIAQTNRKGPLLMGRDTPTHSFTLSLSQRSDMVWSSLTVLQELFGAVEDRLYDHVKLVGEDVEKCLDQLEDSLGRLIWLSSTNSWYLPIVFLVQLVWDLSSLNFWTTKNAATVLNLEEEKLSSWMQDMDKGVCRGFLVPWQT